MRDRNLNLACPRHAFWGVRSLAIHLKQWFFYEGRYARRVQQAGLGLEIQRASLPLTCEGAWMRNIASQPDYAVSGVETPTSAQPATSGNSRMVLSW